MGLAFSVTAKTIPTLTTLQATLDTPSATTELVSATASQSIKIYYLTWSIESNAKITLQNGSETLLVIDPNYPSPNPLIMFDNPLELSTNTALNYFREDLGLVPTIVVKYVKG